MIDTDLFVPVRYVFNITPIGKPRMTQSDKWKKRDCVLRYYTFKDEITNQALQQEFKLQNALNYYFFLLVPNSWTNKRKEAMIGQFCENKPDLDNLIKSVWDALAEEDKSIAWICEAKKLWAWKPKIVVSRVALDKEHLMAYAKEKE